MNESELASRVLECANRVARTTVTMSPEEDIPFTAFQLDSLSFFAFLLEVEKACAFNFDDALDNQEQLRSVRSTAAFIAACQSRSAKAS